MLRKSWSKPTKFEIFCAFNNGIEAKIRISGYIVVVDTEPGQLTAINCTSQTMKRIACEAKLPTYFAVPTGSVAWGLRSDQTIHQVEPTMDTDTLRWSIGKDNENLPNVRNVFFKVSLTNFLGNSTSVEHEYDRQFSGE